MKTLSAGIVPIFLAEHPLFLILRVYAYWDFPKGVVEQAEQPLTCARRELREETGISAAHFDWGREFAETEAYSGGKVARYYVARVAKREVRLSREHHAFRWADYETARGLLVPRLQKVLDWASGRIDN